MGRARVTRAPNAARVLPGSRRMTRAVAGEAAPRRDGHGNGREAHASQFWFWLALAAVAVFLAWLLNFVLLPFVAGLAVAFFLEPVSRRLEQLGVRHALASFIAIVLF